MKLSTPCVRKSVHLIKQRRWLRGAALVEFAMLLGLLLPVGLGMVMLGKLSDVKHSALQASRYATWEATVYSRQELQHAQAEKLESRFFESSNAVIYASSEESSDEPAQHHLWGPSPRQNALRDLASVARHESQSTTTNYSFDTGKAAAGVLTGKSVSLLGKPFSGFSGNSWGLIKDGLLRSDVSAPLQRRGFLQAIQSNCSGTTSAGRPADNNAGAESANDDKPLCLESSGVILADGWGASGDQQSRERIRSLVPSSSMQVLGSGVSGLLGSFLFPELDPLDKSFGYVNMQALPRYAQPE